MGTLRKMGAFLGLVPDESEQYAGRGDRDDRYAADDHAADYDPRYAGDYDASYDADHPADADGFGHEREAAGYEPGYRDAYAADASDSGAAASYDGYGADSYGADGGDHAGRELEYAGRYAEESATDHAAYSPYAGTEPAESGARSLLGGGRRSAGRSTRGSARQSDDVDYSTQGALAVQPQPVEVAAALDPTSGKPATVSLTGFADAREVGELYRTGQAVILDMTELTDAEARRMVDFAAGLAFAVRGSIDKVTTKVFMLHQPEGDTSSGGNVTNDRSGR